MAIGLLEQDYKTEQSLASFMKKGAKSPVRCAQMDQMIRSEDHWSCIAHLCAEEMLN